MIISDETLMAFADGELDDPARTAVESAMRENPEIERRVARHRALRRRVGMAYSAELSEPVSARLTEAVMANADGRREKIVNFKDAVNLKQARMRAAHESSPASRRPTWRSAASIAASVVVGLGVGVFASRQGEPPLLRSAAGALIARGELAAALSQQLAAAQSADSAVHIGVSFLAKSGDYCRTFVLSGAVSPSGLACRHGPDWLIQSLTQESGAGPGTSEYRPAASPMAPAILRSVEEAIAGEPLDQAAEAAARGNHWQNASRHAP